MKAYIGPYRHRWATYNVLHKYYTWRHDKWQPEDLDMLDKAVKAILDGWNNTVCRLVNKVWADRDRNIYIHIDRWDIWNVDETIAHLVFPLLLKLRATQHGAAFVADEDVPLELRSTEAPPKEHDWDTDDNWFKRWDWVLNEIIWTMGTFIHGVSGQFYHHISKDAEVPEGWKWLNGLGKHPGFWLDKPGEEAYHARIDNGLRLFGKYYRSLWD